MLWQGSRSCHLVFTQNQSLLVPSPSLRFFTHKPKEYQHQCNEYLYSNQQNIVRRNTCAPTKQPHDISMYAVIQTSLRWTKRQSRPNHRISSLHLQKHPATKSVIPTKQPHDISTHAVIQFNVHEMKIKTKSKHINPTNIFPSLTKTSCEVICGTNKKTSWHLNSCCNSTSLIWKSKPTENQNRSQYLPSTYQNILQGNWWYQQRNLMTSQRML